MTEALDLDDPLPRGLLRQLRADPDHASEHFALYAVDHLSEESRIYAERVEQANPDLSRSPPRSGRSPGSFP